MSGLVGGVVGGGSLRSSRLSSSPRLSNFLSLDSSEDNMSNLFISKRSRPFFG